MPTPVVGLVMIVRDEEAVLERALRSALPFISTYVIVDTGSVDGTQAVAERVLTEAGLTGLFVSRPWRDFGHNRSEALALCEGRMDWAIMLDADDTLEGTVPPGTLWDHSEFDGIVVRIQHGPVTHQRVQVFHTGRGWRFEGVVHEQPVCDRPANAATGPLLARLPPELRMVSRCEGSRSRNPTKYLDDARLLEGVLERGGAGAGSRTLYYLAQSYRDAGQRTRAREVYDRYLALPPDSTPTQERYMVLVNLIALVETATEQVDLAWSAVELCPQRLEAPYTLLQRWRREGRAPSRQLLALGLAVTNRDVASVATEMLVSPALYEWGMDDEIAVAAFALGRFDVAQAASERCALYASTVGQREAARANVLKALKGCSREPRVNSVGP